MKRARKKELLLRYDRAGLEYWPIKTVTEAEPYISKELFEKIMDHDTKFRLETLINPQFHRIEDVETGYVVTHHLNVLHHFAFDREADGTKLEVPFELSVFLFYNQNDTIHPYYGLLARKFDYDTGMARLLPMSTQEHSDLTDRVKEIVFMHKMKN